MASVAGTGVKPGAWKGRRSIQEVTQNSEGWVGTVGPGIVSPLMFLWGPCCMARTQLVPQDETGSLMFSWLAYVLWARGQALGQTACFPWPILPLGAV